MKRHCILNGSLTSRRDEHEKHDDTKSPFHELNNSQTARKIYEKKETLICKILDQK